MSNRLEALELLAIWAKRSIQENGRYPVGKDGKSTVGFAKIKAEGKIAAILRELGELPAYDPFAVGPKRTHQQRFAEEMKLVQEWDLEESHNATPQQNKTALDAENHNETDS